MLTSDLKGMHVILSILYNIIKPVKNQFGYYGLANLQTTHLKTSVDVIYHTKSKYLRKTYFWDAFLSVDLGSEKKNRKLKLN